MATSAHLLVGSSLFVTIAACATATSDQNGIGGDADAGGREPPGADGGSPGKPDSGLEEPSDAAPAEAEPDAAPPGCTTQTLNLLGNGNLDAGKGGGWLESSSGGYDLIVNQSATEGEVAAHTPVFLAWLGGYADAVDSMSQEIAVPADATDVRVRGQRRFLTDEGGGVYDRSWIEITDTAGTALEVLKQWSNNDKNSSWAAFDLAVAGSYQGQTIRLRLRSDADDSLRTHFFYDSLALDVTSCQ